MDVLVRSIEVCADGSGAPAVMEASGFVWAFDYLGETRYHLIAGPAGALRRARHRSLAACILRYRAIRAELSPEWHAQNAAWYRTSENASETRNAS